MKIYLQTLIVTSLFINIGCQKEETTKEIQQQENISEKEYETISPQKVLYANEINTTGTLLNKNEYQLSFMVGGIVNYLEVEEGDYVKEGQILAKINQTSVNVMTNRLTLAYEKSVRDYDRIKSLYDDGVVTLEDLQNTKTGLDNTKLQLDNARFSKQYASIKAPCSGKILSVQIQKNEMTQAGAPIIIMGNEKSGKVLKTNLADVDIVNVNMNDSCFVEFDAFPNKKFTGYVSNISASADRYTGTYAIEIFVIDTENRLKSGFVGKAKIKSNIEIEYIQIPIESLVSADKMIGKINVLVNNKKQLKTVTIAKILGSKLLIREGLSVNEKIILN